MIFFFRIFNCFVFSGGGIFRVDSEDCDSEEGDLEEFSPATWDMLEPWGDSKPSCPAKKIGSSDMIFFS